MSEKIEKWNLIRSEYVLNEPWFRVKKDVVRVPSGAVIDDYFVWESPTIATVVPITEDKKFVLCQQYRYGVDAVMYQFPAGGVGKGESPKDAAARELGEETGYMADALEFLTRSAAYPTKLSGWHHLYLARDVRLMGVPQPDANEPTRVVLKTYDQLWDMIQAGEFQVADSLVAALLAFKKLGL